MRKGIIGTAGEEGRCIANTTKKGKRAVRGNDWLGEKRGEVRSSKHTLEEKSGGVKRAYDGKNREMGKGARGK